MVLDELNTDKPFQRDYTGVFESSKEKTAIKAMIEREADEAKNKE